MYRPHSMFNVRKSDHGGTMDTMEKMQIFGLMLQGLDEFFILWAYLDGCL